MPLATAIYYKHDLDCQVFERARVITTIFPRIYARTYYAHPRARVMSVSWWWGGGCSRFGHEGCSIRRLQRTLTERQASAPPGSHTARLYSDKALLASKMKVEIQVI